MSAKKLALEHQRAIIIITLQRKLKESQKLIKKLIKISERG